MNLQIESSKKLLKNNIQELINQGRLEEAENLLDQYITIVDDDIDIYSIKGVIHIIRKNFDQAEYILKKGIIIDGNNFDLNYNLAYLYEVKKNKKLSDFYYQKAYSNCEDDEMKKSIESHVKIVENKKKIAFFVKSGMDSFLDDIILGLAKEYEAKKIIVTQYNQIDEGMKWADICWFEWCDELVAYGSKSELSKDKKIICRLHRYEIFTEYPQKVIWQNVDKLIIVTNHLRKLLKAQISDIEEKVDIITINNGVDLNKYKLIERKTGFNVAYVGYIHQRKNPTILLQIMKKLVDENKKYKLYVAGKFQDPLIELYWNYQINKMGLSENVIFEGWQNNIEKWLEDKNYILSTSIHESFGYGIAEAMSMGIKPVIHDFIFSEEIWDKKYLFNTVDEAVYMIKDEKYNSMEYRKFIERHYSLDKEIDRLLEVLKNIQYKDKSIVSFKYLN